MQYIYKIQVHVFGQFRKSVQLNSFCSHCQIHSHTKLFGTGHFLLIFIYLFIYIILCTGMCICIRFLVKLHCTLKCFKDSPTFHMSLVCFMLQFTTNRRIKKNQTSFEISNKNQRFVKQHICIMSFAGWEICIMKNCD